MVRGALQRKALLILLLVAAVAAALGFSFVYGGQYRATARLQIEPAAPASASTSGPGLQREYALLRSRFLADRVVTAEGLAQDQAFLSRFALEGAEPRAIARLVHSAITVDPVPASQLVEISASTPDPVYSARLANAWAEEFVADNYEKRFGSDAAQGAQLSQQLEDQRQELARAEAALAAYADENDVVVLREPSLPGEAVGGELENVQLATLNQAVIDASLRRIAARGALDEEHSEPDLEAVVALRNRRSVAQQELAALGLPEGQETARSQALLAEIAALEGQIARADAVLDPMLQEDYEQAVREEENLRSLFAAEQASLQQDQQLTSEYARLQSDVQTNRDLYAALVQRLAAAAPQDAARNNVALVDRAAPPLHPSGPSLAILLAAAIATALALWLAISFMLESLGARRELRR